MGKGLGIAVFIVAVLAIFIPFYGVHLGFITAILGIVVAAMKEQAFAVAIGALNILNAVFLSPSLKMSGVGAQITRQINGVNSPRQVFWLWVGCAVVSILVAIVCGRQKTPDRASPSGV